MKVEREKGKFGPSTTWLTSPRRQPCITCPSGSQAGNSCRASPSGLLGLHCQYTLNQVARAFWPCLRASPPRLLPTVELL
ncbi:hypothetical protein ACFX1S_015771 [Malus domestica]